VDARRRLAEELLERSQYDAAIDVYQGGLKGIFETRSDVVAGLGARVFRQAGLRVGAADARTIDPAQSRFQIGGCAIVVCPLSRGTGCAREAERAYAAIAPGYPGAEARLRYGVLLKRRGKLAEAHRVLKDLLDGAQLGPAHYRRAQAPWLDRARRELG